jgi:LPXTG-site transpeptidase (sortase) family protein
MRGRQRRADWRLGPPRRYKRSFPLWRSLVGVAFLVLGGALAFSALTGLGREGATRPPAPQEPLLLLDVPKSVAPPAATPEAEGAPTTEPPAPSSLNQSPPVRIVIPAIRVDAEVIALGLDAQAVPQVPDRSNAQRPGRVVAWYDFSARPGQGSNAVFAGHVTWDRAPAVFWDLGKLAAGDLLRIVVQDGRQLVYQVSETFMVDPAQPDAVRVMYPTSEDMVTLITCGGTFVPDRASPLGGDYSHRVVVRARLVGVEGG